MENHSHTIRSNISPRTEPCGTTCFISLQKALLLFCTEFLLSVLLISTNHIRHNRCGLNHKFLIYRMPLFSLVIKIYLLITPYSFIKSKSIPAEFTSVSMVSCLLSRKGCIVAVAISSPRNHSGPLLIYNFLRQNISTYFKPIFLIN